MAEDLAEDSAEGSAEDLAEDSAEGSAEDLVEDLAAGEVGSGGGKKRIEAPQAQAQKR